MYGKTISYSKTILNQHPYFWISKGQQTSIFSAGQFAAYWLLRQVHWSGLRALRNIMICHHVSPSPCCHHVGIWQLTNMCFFDPPEPPPQPASPHWDYWSHLQAYYMVLSVWHAPKILIRAGALKAWSKESQAARLTGPGVFKVLVMRSWSYAGLIIDSLRAAKDISDVTRTQTG